MRLWRAGIQKTSTIAVEEESDHDRWRELSDCGKSKGTCRHRLPRPTIASDATLAAARVAAILFVPDWSGTGTYAVIKSFRRGAALALAALTLVGLVLSACDRQPDSPAMSTPAPPVALSTTVALQGKDSYH